MSKLDPSLCGSITEEELQTRFETLGETFAAGYAAGSADTNLRVLRALRGIIAILERNMAEDVAAFDGDPPPASH
jgi:hypothetical protein